MQLLLRVCGIALLGLEIVYGQARITCSSNNGARNLCRADTSRGVKLVNQLSSSRCIQGRTWGWNEKGIWVDQGCPAEFALGRSSGYYPGGPGRPPGRPVTQIITCSSDNGKRNWCGNPTNGQVRLIKQRSGSPCRRGDTWGTQPGSIWVDRGCRADFEVTSGG